MYKIAREEVAERKQYVPLAERIILVLLGVPIGVFCLSFGVLAALAAFVLMTTTPGSPDSAFTLAVWSAAGWTCIGSLITIVAMTFLVSAGICFGGIIKGLLAQGG